MEWLAQQKDDPSTKVLYVNVAISDASDLCKTMDTNEEKVTIKNKPTVLVKTPGVLLKADV